jgi:hypothetical protein
VLHRVPAGHPLLDDLAQGLAAQAAPGGDQDLPQLGQQAIVQRGAAGRLHAQPVALQPRVRRAVAFVDRHAHAASLAADDSFPPCD